MLTLFQNSLSKKMAKVHFNLHLSSNTMCPKLQHWTKPYSQLSNLEHSRNRHRNKCQCEIAVILYYQWQQGIKFFIDLIQNIWTIFQFHWVHTHAHKHTRTRELEDLPGFFFYCHKLKNIKYAGDTMLILDVEWNLESKTPRGDSK